MDCIISSACSCDAEGISRVIVAALRDTNARDYSEAVIARVEQSFSSAAVSNLMMRRVMFVALDQGSIVGTASLDAQVVRTVFVAPEYQSHGIGRALMAQVERAAVEKGVTVQAVPSSFTAEPFYATLGFSRVRDTYNGEERTIVMEHPLR